VYWGKPEIFFDEGVRFKKHCSILSLVATAVLL